MVQRRVRLDLTTPIAIADQGIERQRQESQRNALARFLPQALRGDEAALDQLLQANPEAGLQVRSLLAQESTRGTKKPPTGFTFNDPTNPAAGVTPIPGFIEGQTRIAQAKRPQVNVTTKLPPAETEEQKAQGKFFGERFKAVQEASSNARNVLNKVERFKQLSARTPTGSVQQMLLPIRQALVSSGVATKEEAERVADLEGLRSLGVDFALQTVQQTKGAISNAEMQLFIQAASNIGNTPEGNKVILDAQEKIANRQIEVAELQRKYRQGEPIEINGQVFRAPRRGTVDGFQSVLDAFHTANPVFTEEEQAVLQQPPEAVVPQGDVPAGAIDFLRANPNLADQFDAKFGQGAAARVLGGQ